LLVLLGLQIAAAPNAHAQDARTQPTRAKAAKTQDVKPPAAKKIEEKISAAEAEELFRSVDGILKFASDDTGLPIKEPVKRRMVGRDEVVAYLEGHMNKDEDAQRLARSEQLLKKLGLLPRNFELKKFLLGLLREQVAGYYDPETKTVNLLDWVEPGQQRPVLAHELTHALQDQNFDLLSWTKGPGALPTDDRALTAAVLADDEALEARQAVLEGQAMAVLVDYSLAPSGQTLVNSPQLVDALKEGMLVGTADQVQFHAAPLALKESLTFPYRFGLDFVGDVLRGAGKESAFAGTMRQPPANTRQVMEPGVYRRGERLPAMPVPDFATVFRSYERFDAGAFGEFDTALLVNQFAGVGASRALYPEWRGGYFYAARPKGDDAAPLGLLYVSRWSESRFAERFAAVYARSLTERYQRAREVVAEGAPTVPLTDHLDRLQGAHTWLTEEGPVVIAVEQNLVVVMESLDPATSEKLQQSLGHAAQR
jgi:hypothetical protein